MIITSNPELKHVILDRIHRGVTWWKGNGAYTGDDKEILLCVMNRYEVRYMKKLIQEIRSESFPSADLDQGSPWKLRTPVNGIILFLKAVANSNACLSFLTNL